MNLSTESFKACDNVGIVSFNQTRIQGIISRMVLASRKDGLLSEKYILKNVQ